MDVRVCVLLRGGQGGPGAAGCQALLAVCSRPWTRGVAAAARRLLPPPNRLLHRDKAPAGTLRRPHRLHVQPTIRRGGCCCCARARGQARERASHCCASLRAAPGRSSHAALGGHELSHYSWLLLSYAAMRRCVLAFEAPSVVTPSVTRPNA